MPSWGLVLLALIIAGILGYTFIFLVEYKIKRKFNKQIKDDFRRFKGIRFIKNDYGICDIESWINGRKIEIKHLSDIWVEPKELVIEVQHNIPDIVENIEIIGLTFTPKFVRKKLNEWPKNKLIDLKKIIKIIKEAENQPELIFINDEESLMNY